MSSRPGNICPICMDRQTNMNTVCCQMLICIQCWNTSLIKDVSVSLKCPFCRKSQGTKRQAANTYKKFLQDKKIPVCQLKFLKMINNQPHIPNQHCF